MKRIVLTILFLFVFSFSWADDTSSMSPNVIYLDVGPTFMWGMKGALALGAGYERTIGDFFSLGVNFEYRYLSFGGYLWNEYVPTFETRLYVSGIAPCGSWFGVGGGCSMLNLTGDTNVSYTPVVTIGVGYNVVLGGRSGWYVGPYGQFQIKIQNSSLIPAFFFGCRLGLDF